MPGLYAGGDYDLAGFAVGAAERGTLLPRAGDRGRATCCSACPPRACIRTASRWCAASSRRAGLAWTRPGAVRARPDARRGAARADPDLREAAAGRAEGRRDAIKALAHITGGGFPDNMPRVLPDGLGIARRPRGDRPCRRSSAGSRATGGVAEREMLRTFNCGIGMVVVAPAATADAVVAALAAGRRGSGPARRRSRRGGAERVTYHGHASRSDMAARGRPGRDPDLGARLEHGLDRSTPRGRRTTRPRSRSSCRTGPTRRGSPMPPPAGIPTKAVDHRRFPDRASLRREPSRRELEAARDRARLPRRLHARSLTAWFVERWAGRMLNIHPSLLPLFRGLHTHAQALAAGVRVHGCTVHFVVPELDAGPIVAQAAVPVLPGDDRRQPRRPRARRRSTGSTRWRSRWWPAAGRASRGPASSSQATWRTPRARSSACRGGRKAPRNRERWEGWCALQRHATGGSNRMPQARSGSPASDRREAALHGGARQDPVEPAPDMGQRAEVDPLLLVVLGPGQDRDVGDGIVARHVLAIGETPVEDAVEPTAPRP